MPLRCVVPLSTAVQFNKVLSIIPAYATIRKRLYILTLAFKLAIFLIKKIISGSKKTRFADKLNRVGHFGFGLSMTGIRPYIGLGFASKERRRDNGNLSCQIGRYP